MLLDQNGNEILAVPVDGELAASSGGRDVTRLYLGEVMVPQDALLAGQGALLVEYRKLLDDWQVQSTFQQRRRAVTSRPWQVKPGGTRRIDRMAAEFLEEVLNVVEWDARVNAMMYGIHFGYAVAELLYTRDGQYVYPESIRVRDRGRFRWGQDGRLRLLTPAKPTAGEVMPENKFWTFTVGGDHDDDPYGMGLAHYLYWPCLFKRHGVRFWLGFMEKFATPTTVGEFPPGTPDAEKKKLLSALVALTTDSAVIYPQGWNVKHLESLRTGTGSYDSFLAYMDGAIAKVVLSQTMTTDDGSSRSQAEVHQDVAENIVKGDADLVCASFNRGPVRWLARWNFPDAALPQVWYSFEEPEDLNTAAERDERITKLGYRPSAKRVQDVYGEGYETLPTLPERAGNGSGTTRVGGAEGAAFAEDRPFTPDVYADRLAREADEMVAVWVERVGQLLADVDDLQAFAERLPDLLVDMPPDRMAAVVQQALASGHLAGRFEVREGRDE
jgi:phage gp29-like protein